MRLFPPVSAVLLASCAAPADRAAAVARDTTIMSTVTASDTTAAATDRGPTAISAIPALPKVGAVEADSGPPVRVDRQGNRMQLVMLPAPGDQINALQPPVLTTQHGRRLVFRGSAVTNDSAYFVGDVVLPLPAEFLPLDGTLVTSYCRAGEKLCRTARRVVRASP